MKKKGRILDTRGMAPPELLIAVIIIGLLALTVAILVDRSLAIKRARDLTRFNHSQVILGSILRYEIDTRGDVPAGIDDDDNTWQMISLPDQICVATCENREVVEKCADLNQLIPEYVDFIPQDDFFTGMGSSGYYINKQTKRNIVTVGACTTETVPIIEIRQ